MGLKNIVKGIGKVFNDFPIIGDAIGAATDIFGTSSANKANIKQAQKQMDFQERMSSTEIQRRTQDLLAAGMNPMLAYNQGGASSASGAKAEVQSVTGKAVNSALAIRQQRMALEQMQAQTRLLEEQRQGVGIDNQIKSAEIPWSADKAAFTQGKLEAEVTRIRNELRLQMQALDISKEDLINKQLTNEQLRKMQPLLQEAQRVANKLQSLELPEKQATASWFEGPLGGGGRAANAAKDLIQILKAIRGK